VRFFEAVKNYDRVIPVFFINPEIITEYEVEGLRLDLLLSVLRKLDQELKEAGGRLFVFYDAPKNVMEELIKEHSVSAVYTNRAYSFTGEAIDKKVKSICSRLSVKYLEFSDNFLVKPEEVPFKKVFRYFFESWKGRVQLKSVGTVSRIISHIQKWEELKM
jgi:deoxyribodipyrimidine photo-lyase